MSLEEEPDIRLGVKDDNLLEWRAFIRGPTDTPYADGIFELSIVVPPQYPVSPPTINFVTSVFHPNVHEKTGEVCVDILKTEWTPAWTLLAACRAVRAVLEHPNAESPLNCDAGNLIRNGQQDEFENVARNLVRDKALTEFPGNGSRQQTSALQQKTCQPHSARAASYWYYALALSPLCAILLLHALDMFR